MDQLFGKVVFQFGPTERLDLDDPAREPNQNGSLGAALAFVRQLSRQVIAR